MKCKKMVLQYINNAYQMYDDPTLQQFFSCIPEGVSCSLNGDGIFIVSLWENDEGSKKYASAEYHFDYPFTKQNKEFYAAAACALNLIVEYPKDNYRLTETRDGYVLKLETM